MKEMQNILVPVDFSDISEKLVEYGLNIAEKYEARVHFLHVVVPFHADAIVGIPMIDEVREQVQKSAESEMQKLLSEAKKEYKLCEGEVVKGDPVDVILETAKNKSADLIVISTHGLKGLETLLLGSVTKRVIKRAVCPVFVLNPDKNIL